MGLGWGAGWREGVGGCVSLGWRVRWGQCDRWRMGERRRDGWCRRERVGGRGGGRPARSSGSLVLLNLSNSRRSSLSPVSDDACLNIWRAGCRCGGSMRPNRCCLGLRDVSLHWRLCISQRR